MTAALRAGSAGLASTWERSGGGAGLATRRAMRAICGEIGRKVPGLIGGSADLVGSTKTILSTGGSFSRENPAGRNMYFGVREHAMGTIRQRHGPPGGTPPVGGLSLRLQRLHVAPRYASLR